MIMNEKSMNAEDSISSQISKIILEFKLMQPALIPIQFSAQNLVYIDPSSFLISSDCNILLYTPPSDISSIHTFPEEIISITACTNYCYISFSEEIKKYSLPSFKCIDTFFGHTSIVKCLIIDQNNEFLYSGSEDCSIRQWNISNIIEVTNKILYLHDSKIQALDISKDSRLLVSLGYDSFIKVYDIKLENIIKTLECNYNSCSIKISSCNNYIGALNNRSIDLWNLKKNWAYINIQVHNGIINSLDFTLDEKFIITGSDDYGIGVINIENNCKTIYQYHNNKVNCVGVTSDNMIYSVANDNCIGCNKLLIPEGDYELTSNDIKVETYVILEQVAVIFGENDDLFVIQTWNLDTCEKILQNITNFQVDIAIECMNFAVCACNDKKMRIIDKNGKILDTFDIDALLLSSYQEKIAIHIKNSINIYNFPEFSNHISRILIKSTPSIISIFNQDLYTGEFSGEIKLFNIYTSTKLKNLIGHNNKVIAIQASIDLKFLFTSEDMQLIIIWDYQKSIPIIKLSEIQITGFYCSNNQEYMFLCSRDKGILFLSMNDFSVISEVHSIYHCSQMKVNYNEKQILVKEISSIHILPNPLIASGLLSIGGTNYNKLEYMQYILSIPNSPKYNQQNYRTIQKFMKPQYPALQLQRDQKIASEKYHVSIERLGTSQKKKSSL